MRFSAADVAAAVGGRLVGEPVVFSGASIDSRTVEPGQLFVPIVAERDGHDFIEAALSGGAGGYLTSREPREGSAIVVHDTLQALADLGSHARSALPDSVVGITGSVGKTTAKDMLAAILRRSRTVAASDRSFNNELGVPLTLINAPEGTATAIVEMGARGAGHIRALCRIARPTVGVVTLIALAHAELFGDLETIAAAKGELIESLPPDGAAVLNGDDPHAVRMAARTNARVLLFGSTGDVVVHVRSLTEDLRVELRIESAWGTVETVLGARGAHQVTNAAAAAAAAFAVGASAEDVGAGLAEAPKSAWRMQLVQSAEGVLIVNDAYNANRTSTEAALHALASLDRPRKTAVLGLMAELGEAAPAEHRAVADLADELGIDLIAFGTDLYGVQSVQTLDDAVAALGELEEGDVVLIKGSRVNELERLVARLLD